MERKRYQGIPYNLYEHTHPCVLGDACDGPAGRTWWDIPDRDGRYNTIVTSGGADTRAEAIAAAEHWIAEWHGRRAARYGVYR